VTYDGNGNTGGSVPTDSTQYIQGQTVDVLGNTVGLIKLGYAFEGWNTQSNGSGTSYSPGDTFAMGTANVTLYAQWLKGVVSATCSTNGDCNASLFCICSDSGCFRLNCQPLACNLCNYNFNGTCFPVNAGITTPNCMGTKVCGNDAFNNSGMCVLVNGQTCAGSLPGSSCANAQCCASDHCVCNSTPANCATGDPPYFICG
jgi:uncharacterized repeat protein (TIGR02543 family)